MKIKKAVSAALVLCMTLGPVPMSAFADGADEGPAPAAIAAIAVGEAPSADEITGTDARDENPLEQPAARLKSLPGRTCRPPFIPAGPSC